MSEYTEKVSVGGAYAKGGVYSVDHPAYRAFADAVDERVQGIAVDRGVSRASTRTVLLGVSLLPDESVALAEAYPEFTIVMSGRSRPAHATWVAYRRIANEWLMEQADKFSGKIMHLGGSLASHLLASSGSHVTLLCDLTEPVGVHEKYATTMEAHALFENYMATSRVLGRTLDHRVYDEYLRGEGLRFHTKLTSVPDADVLLVDLTICDYSPMQVASLMKQSGSQVAFGFFVYHPSMLFADEGEVGQTGVYFRKQDSRLLLQYPEGVAGVVDMGAHTWQSWLVAHTFCLGKGAGASWYQLELLQNRGHLMFFRVTALDVEPSSSTVSHALDTNGQDSYVVSSWRLKYFGVDPTRPTSWQHGAFVVNRRMLDRLYQFAMQLPKEQFTRYALRKQVSVINDRVVVEGTMVRVNKPLPVEEVDALVVAVYARAFADRYITSQLTAEAMRVVKSVEAFSRAGTLARVGYITWVCLQSAYDYTFGALDQLLRTASDSVRDSMSMGLPHMAVQFGEMPAYMLVSEASRGWQLPSDVGVLVARENARLAAVTSRGFGARWSRAFAGLAPSLGRDVHRRYRVDQVNIGAAARAYGDAVDKALAAVREEVAMDEPGPSRDIIEASMVVRQVREFTRVDFEPVADPVEVLNWLHSAAFPGVAEQNLEYDTASLSLDPQHRVLAASRMVLPTYMGEAPVSRRYYRSKVRALNVPKRQQTIQELTSSIAARNTNAPTISMPQDEDSMVLDVWGTFLDNACVPDARDKLRRYRADPVAWSEDSFREWISQTDAAKLESVRKEFEQSVLSFSEMSVGDYLVMLKSDAKPPLSVKPIDQRIEPQVIVYHPKPLSALFSALFRVLVRRFVSLLKPNYHVNLLKDTVDIEAFIRGIHPFGNRTLKYLENDFSKYDKSQGRFAFLLETNMFEQLGMNEDMLSHWMGGHVRCSMRAVSMAMSLEVWYQRKSGDATTAFGNVALNIMSVTYAYKATDVAWALFMGDDSLVCSPELLVNKDAVDVLSSVFNLGAKMFITTSPYYASNFVFIDDGAGEVALVPDPVKRAERWSMHISADDPQWSERYKSAKDSMGVYLNCFNLPGLPRALLERYGIATDVSKAVGSAIATVLRSEKDFRNMWEELPEVSSY